MIADIFGDSSDDENEFQGFDESEIKKPEEPAVPDLSSDEEEVEGRGKG